MARAFFAVGDALRDALEVGIDTRLVVGYHCLRVGYD
jgi:hypothetical protein